MESIPAECVASQNVLTTFGVADGQHLDCSKKLWGIARRVDCMQYVRTCSAHTDKAHLPTGTR
jgi:hypothetical protein